MTKLKKIVVFIDMDDVLCDYAKAHKQHLLVHPEVTYPQSQYGFFTSLEPIEGGVENVKLLINDNRFSPYILTSPSYMNPLCYTEKRVWIERYFGLEFTQRLIISADKSLMKGDVLIDDNAQGNGQEKFDGTLIQFGTAEYPSWTKVMKRLIDLVSK